VSFPFVEFALGIFRQKTVVQVREEFHLRGLPFDSGCSRFKVFGVDFARREVDAEVMRRDGDASASEVSIQHALARLSELAKGVLIERHRLLRGVDLAFVVATRQRIALEDDRVAVERDPCLLCLREVTILEAFAFVPDHEAAGWTQREVVSAPYDLRLGDAEEFVEVFRGWDRIVPFLVLGFVLFAAIFSSSGRCADAIGRVDDGEVEVTIWEALHHVHAVSQAQIQRT
jgi:hypothetical protein